MVGVNYVYVLKHLDGIKIGRTTNLRSRISGHKGSNPWIEYVKSYKAPASCETYVHKRLSEHLRDGCTEWFNYYEGIYEDIDKYVEEGITFENAAQQAKKLKQEKFLYNYLEFNTYRVHKFKDISRNNFAFVVAENKLRAEMLLKITTFVNVAYLGSKSLNCLDTILDTQEYIAISQIRTKDEYHWCMTRKVNYNTEYGITIPRRKELMVAKDFVPYQSKKGYKNKRSGIKKNNNHKGYKQYDNN